MRISSRLPVSLFLSFLFLCVAALAQSYNASLTGVVSDETGAVIPGVEVVLTNLDTEQRLTFVTDDNGRYAFPNLQSGRYQLQATMPGFREFIQRGIELGINDKARINVILEIGELSETLEVVGNASQLNFENATREEGITPVTLQKLPLLVSGTVRSSAGFAVLMPGVNTGGSNNAFDARINGGIQSGDEAVLDGVTMQQGFMSQTGMISIFQDFPFSPDMVSEVKVLTSNYEPQYGGTSSAIVVAETKSGTNEFHGSGFEFHRNTVLNARSWGARDRPPNLQHNFGANIGGPAKIPGLWSDDVKTYFYFNYEGFRISGGATAPIVSIPSLKNRQGDFSDWVDAEGNLIPIFDPLTTRANPAFDASQDVGPNNLPFLRDQFMGCDGNSPNVICPDRITNSLAQQWFRFLPNPTFDGPLNNFQAEPVPDVLLANSNYYFWRIDTNVGDRDHFYASFWHQRAPPNFNTILPIELSDERVTDPQNSWVNRLNWTHTFNPSLLHHFSIGYLNRNEGNGDTNAAFIDQFPQIPGTARPTHAPAIRFSDGFEPFGGSRGDPTFNKTTRPTVAGNSQWTWVRGDHTFKFGAEYRDPEGNIRAGGNEAGTFNFNRLTTGLRGINSGSPLASFLLETVSDGNVTFRAVSDSHPRQEAFVLHGGDTWKATPDLTVNYGLRWDVFTPAIEKFDRASFFDPTLPNPGAGGRLGALAFADEFQERMGRRHPEETWTRGFAPRLGVAYAVNDQTVVRAGYGVFFHQAYCPGWNGCIAQDGFSSTVSFTGALGGLEPAFILSQGFPQDFQRPPFLEPDFRNGQSLMYRPFEANRRSYSQQWNLTIEREIGKDLMISTAYVGNKGTRLPSSIAAINVLNPSLLSMGELLFDEFEPGQQELHGVPLPYAGWVEQMTSCRPNVAQALLPFPQFCSRLQGVNETAGLSTYHSFQLKADKRFSEGSFLLLAYTFSKLLTTTEQVNDAVGATSSVTAVMSPFQRHRARSLAANDVPQVLSVSFIYDLPGGDFQGPASWFLGGWSLTNIFRASSGMPFYFRSDSCNIPGQFRMSCLPAVRDGVDPFSQNKDDFDPGRGPLFNPDAFEAVDFNFFAGTGPRVSNVRGFGFKNHDISFVKDTPIGEYANFQFRAELFNIWNWHSFAARGDFGSQAFNTNLAAADFGNWNGAVSAPRTIQFSARIEF